MSFSTTITIMPTRAIRIIERCEFGEPGDVVRPEPYDVAVLLVEIRRVAVFVEEPGEMVPATLTADAIDPPLREPRRRRRRD
jgi:hypothetical protein